MRLATTPLEYHFWNVAFHLTARGLTSRPMPWPPGGTGLSFTIDFDFALHRLEIRTSDGRGEGMALVPMTVRDFHAVLLECLARLGIEPRIDDRPVEIPGDRLPFHLDRTHRAYCRDWVAAWFDALRRSALVLEGWRGRFVGKPSPVHFFWGSFDLACSRFSGRPAPPRDATDAVTREAYTHEVMSVGFRPGDARHRQPAYYAYAVPTPASLPSARVVPWQASWSSTLGEFVLPYEAVRRSPRPEQTLYAFAQSTHEAAADARGWDRGALERSFSGPGRGQPEEPLDASSPLFT